jgi:hypothetical protein
MADDDIRSQQARRAAELALVRVAHHYGGKPEYVLLGGLVPALLCAAAPVPHAGTTDVDVQLNLEIAAGSANTARLEQALGNAEFVPDVERVWRWKLTDTDGPAAVVKFELLADLDDQPNHAIVRFDGCQELGAVNLRGTGYASRDVVVREMSVKDGGILRTVNINVTGLGGFLMAKAGAAHGRHKAKDWYDIAYVLLHNDSGGQTQAAAAVRNKFGAVAVGGPTRTWFVELESNFADDRAQGTAAYVNQLTVDEPGTDAAEAAAEARTAVRAFVQALT